jgi:hypothetical protein
MNNLFQSHKELTEEDFNNLWQRGLFVFDANVLLDLYRLPESARNDLLAILSNERIINRVWLPFQVSLEYTYNKLEAISDQKNKFNSVQQIVNETISQIQSTYMELQKKLGDLQLKKRHSVINPDEFVNDSLFKQATEQLTNFSKKLKELDEKQPDVNDKDLIKSEIARIFNEKVGKPFTNDELKEIYKEGEDRYKDNIPPGFRDKSKEGFYLFEDKKLIRKFGDLLVWKEILKKCEDEKLEYIALVTGDTKEDWWQEKRGKKIGPRYELLNEIYHKVKTVKLFHIYDTSSFMQYAKKHIKVDIKEQSIVETKDLLEIDRDRVTNDKLEDNFLSLVPVLKDIHTSHFPNLSLELKLKSSETRFLRISAFDFYSIIFEIFENALQHSIDHKVFFRLYDQNGYTVLRFKNARKLGANPIEEKRKNGFVYISETMKKYGYMSIANDKDFFIIRLFFLKQFCQ